MDVLEREMVERVRAAVKDRAIWFALLYRSFRESLPEEEVERLARKAIREFGRLKALKDPEDFGPGDWVRRHVEKGSHLIFDSDVQEGEGLAIQRMKHCALVEAWKEMGCSEEEIRLFCDIAMEGDRGRAEAHGVKMEIKERIAMGDPHCRLEIFVH
ncbi:MAG: L-2-amino-thiazoline-4-carboxylic acid hydrolase [Thermodesulfobacteriota bacterium]